MHVPRHGYNSCVDPAPRITRDAAGQLVSGSLLHRSRHADTLHATWNGRPVVVKRVRDDLDAEDSGAAARTVVREGYLLQRFDHPGIVRVVNVAEQPAMLVLELVPGRTLREELKQRRRMPAAELARIGMQLAATLDHLHRHWVLHRDVKPANVVYDGVHAVLIDFHLAKEPGAMRGGAGTRLFTAPEQVRGGVVGPPADIWGLGTVLYRAATSRLPFNAETGHPQLTVRPAPALERLARTRFDGDLDAASRELPRDLALLIDRMLDERPRRRPEADEVREALAPFAAPVAASGPTAFPGVPRTGAA